MQPVYFNHETGDKFDYGQARSYIRELYIKYQSDADLIQTSQ